MLRWVLLVVSLLAFAGASQVSTPGLLALLLFVGLVTFVSAALIFIADRVGSVQQGQGHREVGMLMTAQQLARQGGPPVMQRAPVSAPAAGRAMPAVVGLQNDATVAMQPAVAADRPAPAPTPTPARPTLPPGIPRAEPGVVPNFGPRPAAAKTAATAPHAAPAAPPRAAPAVAPRTAPAAAPRATPAAAPRAVPAAAPGVMPGAAAKSAPRATATPPATAPTAARPAPAPAVRPPVDPSRVS
jgi:hypothetical protein